MTSDKWVVLGKPECQWCVDVQELLHDHDIEFTYMNIVGNELTWFLMNSGLQTVPQVFLNGTLVGGYEGTQTAIYTLERIRGKR